MKKFTNWFLVTLGLAILCCALALPVQAAWRLEGGALNTSPDRYPHGLKLVNTPLTAYVAFVEGTSPSMNLFVKRYNGRSWTTLGGALNMFPVTESDMAACDLALAGGVPYVAWYEHHCGTNVTGIYVKYLNGTKWVQLGDRLNFDTSVDYADIGSAAIAVDNSSGRIYVAYKEKRSGAAAYEIYVKSWNGVSWAQVGASLNCDNTKDADDPDIIVDNGTPFVSFHEADSSIVSHLYVKCFNGTSWGLAGTGYLDSANLNSRSSEMAIHDADKFGPYITWCEKGSYVYVKLYDRDSNSWSFVGSGPITDNASHPSIDTDANNAPYVACWIHTPICPSSTELNVYHFDDSFLSWSRYDPNYLNFNTAVGVEGFYEIKPSISLVKEGAFSLRVAWDEENTSGGESLFEKRYVPGR
ncbi:MAG: hypothetical protein WC901_07710 [Candidatus Margulisiibacteriota bacterium]